jgi:hypothetical protein
MLKIDPVGMYSIDFLRIVIMIKLRRTRRRLKYEFIRESCFGAST